MSGLRWGNVVHIGQIDSRAGFGGVDMDRFVKLLAILGQFKSSAHLCALRTFFIRHELVATPMRGDLLLGVVLGLLQLPAVGKQNEPVVLVIRQVNFRFIL